MRLALVSLLCVRAWAANTMPPEAEQRLAREIYKQMIEVKSGFTTGSTTPIAESVAARFKAAGFPASDIFVGGAIPTKANVVVRYRGTGAASSARTNASAWACSPSRPFHHRAPARVSRVQGG